MIWTDQELPLFHHALGLLGDRMAEHPEEYTPQDEEAHTSMSLRLSEVLVQRELEP